jgi:hypothetical protein
MCAESPRNLDKGAFKAGPRCIPRSVGRVKASSLHLPNAAFRRCTTTNEARHWMRDEAGMSSGTDTRQRGETLSARFNETEADAVRQMADRAGTSVASVIRTAVLNQPIPRATRRPTVNHQMAARVLGELGRVAEALREATGAGRADPKDPNVAAAFRDLAEMRTVCFLAMGREP